MLKDLKHIMKFALFKAIERLTTNACRPIVPRTLLIVRLDAIGDYILFRNFLEIVRNSNRFRDYKICLCGNIIWKELSETFDHNCVNDFIWINGREFNKNYLYRYKALKDIRSRGFEVAINPAFSRTFFYGDAIVRASNARYTIGSTGNLDNISKWQKRISDRYYTELIPVSAGELFEFERNRRFFEHILGTKIHLKKPQLDIHNIYTAQRAPFVVISPGANADFRRWHPEGFAATADFIATRYGLDVVIVGNEKDKSLAQMIRSFSKSGNTVDLTGETSLKDLVRLISEARLIITNDTGTAHIAVAVNRPVIVISNGDNRMRFVEYPKEIYDKNYAVLPDTHLSDINTITPDEVNQTVEKVLSESL